MTRTSENGWPVLTKDQTAVIRVGGAAFRVAPGTETLWTAFLTRFIAEVEPLTGPVLDDWSWADRPIRGSTVTSNHASATALDLNSTRHPLGAVGTFTDAQEKALRAILRDFPVLRWGGTYVHRKDEMHVELNATAEDVAVFTRTLNKPPEDEVTPDELRAAIRAELPGILKLTIQTGWLEDGTKSATPQDIPLSKVFAGDRGASLAAAAATTRVEGRLVGLEQSQNSILEAVAALAAKVDALTPPQPPAPPAGG